MGGGETPPRRAGPEMGGGVALPLPGPGPVGLPSRRAPEGPGPRRAPGPGSSRGGPQVHLPRAGAEGDPTPPFLHDSTCLPACLALPVRIRKCHHHLVMAAKCHHHLPSSSRRGTRAPTKRAGGGGGTGPVGLPSRLARGRRAPHATRRESQSTEEAVPIIESRMRRCRATHHPPRGRRRQERMRAPFRVETPACPPPACMPCPRAPDVRRGSDRHQRVPSSASHERRVLRQPSAQGRSRRSWT